MLQLSQSEIEDLIIPCIGSTPITGLTLFQDHFTRPFCIVHNQIFSILDDDKIKLAAIAAPRGFGKTTSVGLGFVGRKALFREAPYIVYISSTVTEAAAKVKTLAKELLENDLVKSLFGDLKGVKWAEEKGEIELSDANGPFCFIQAKGAGSQIRGLKWGKHRPSLFVIDDLEDSEEVMNEVLRKKLKEWFFADLLGARDQSEESKTRIIVIGTILHEDALLANLLDESTEDKDADIDDMSEIDLKEQFVTLRLEACDDEFRSVWPEYLSDAALRRKALAYERRGLIDVFYREWRNIVISKDNATFQQSMFQRYSETDRSFTSGCENVVILDPAKTTNTTSAFSAITGVGFDSTNARILFRDCKNIKAAPDTIFKECCDMADILGTCNIGVEVTGLNDYILYPFQQYIATRPKYYNLISIKAIKDKDLRIAALAPFYRMKMIWHNEDVHVRGPLETQLLSFPRSKFKDVMDCFANCIEMFSLGDRNFAHQMAPKEDGSPRSIEDEYDELRKEDKLETKIKRHVYC